MKLCAGAWAMKNGSLAFSAALCGVTPQAQNTGTIPGGVGGTGPPNNGSFRSAPIAEGSPRWIGAPWLNGNRHVTSVAVLACGAVSQRMVTIMSPRNGPAG